MNKRGSIKSENKSKASPSKPTTQSSLSKYFLGAKKEEKKEEEKKPQKKQTTPPKKDERKRGRQSDEEEEEEVVAPKIGNRRLKKKNRVDDDDDEDFTPTTAKESDNEEMSEGEEEEEKEDSPKKNSKKSTASRSKKDSDVLSSQSPSSSQSQDSSPKTKTTIKTTTTIDREEEEEGEEDKDTIITQFKDNPKLRKEFQKKLNKIIEAKDNINNSVPDPSLLTQNTKEKKDTKEKKGKKSTLTPLEQQYVAIKKEYPDTVLLVECGYKYKFFGEDALVANKILKMVCYPKNNFLNASIPTVRLNVHVRRLLHAGYKVGIVKQTITAAAKKASDKVSGPFSRALSALYTPATYIDDDIGNQDEDEQSTNNYLMCLTEEPITSEKVRISLVAVSLGTGDIIYDSFEDDFMRSALETRLLHLLPKEFILPLSLSSLSSSSSSGGGFLSEDTDRVLRNHASVHSARVETLENDKFAPDVASFNVTEFYENQKNSDDDDETPLAFVLKLPKSVITCLGVMIDYLKDFQKLNQVFCLTGNFRSFSTANHMLLNGITLANLEILVNNNNFEEKGSLFWVLKHTSTAFGKRLLKKWVTQPLVDISKIKERQDAVTEVAEGASNSSVVALYSLFKTLPDLERILCRIHYKRCSPSEFANALRNFDKVASALPSMKHLQSPMLRHLISSFPPIGKSAEYFLESISPTAAADGNLQELFVDSSQFPDIAEAKKRLEKIKDQLNEHLKELRKILNKPTLNYSHMPKVNLEYFIELTNAQAKNVPANWKKVSTTKGLCRYQTDFIFDKLQQLALARENLGVVCQQSWIAFLDEFGGKYVEFREAVSRLAVMDCICSLASIAKNPSYCRPVFSENQQLTIEDGRHPVVETVMADNYVPNSTRMSGEKEKCMIITGPNMGGKSSYIRQIALIIIMAQIGSYVPATSVTLSPFDAVYTRMGAQDNIEKGQSTFFVELQEASSILQQATPRSLVILDELGRGTSTHDGVAIAYATLQYLVQTLNCFSLFVTHYPLLAELEHAYSKSVANYHMAFLEEKDDEDENAPPHVTFLFKVTKGAAMNSYGLNVARIAGIPNSILAEASQQSTQLKNTITERAFRSKEKYPQILANKVAQIIAKYEDDTDNNNNDNDNDNDNNDNGESKSYPSLESLFTLQQAARKALDL